MEREIKQNGYMAVLYDRLLTVIFSYSEFMSTQDLAGPGTRELNLEGKMVVPGFIDSHVHLISGGLQVPQHSTFPIVTFLFSSVYAYKLLS